jgi:hypothetical protein
MEARPSCPWAFYDGREPPEGYVAMQGRKLTLSSAPGGGPPVRTTGSRPCSPFWPKPEHQGYPGHLHGEINPTGRPNTDFCTRWRSRCMTEYYCTLEKQEVDSVEMQSLSQGIMPSGWRLTCARAGATRLRLKPRRQAQPPSQPSTIAASGAAAGWRQSGPYQPQFYTYLYLHRGYFAASFPFQPSL